MSDALLTSTDREETLSRVYAHAVAAIAGYTTAVYDYDRDGVDIRIQSGGAMRPALELQLKATIGLGEPDGNGRFHFPLKQRNYEQLIIDTQTPRLLVVLELPRDESQWATIATDELVLRRRTYWLNLKGNEETNNRASTTVYIPQENVFDIDNLRKLMDQSRTGSIH